MAAKKTGQPQQSLQQPNPDGANYLVDRDEWIEKASAGFIAKGKANKVYYKAILEAFWPVGYGLPGPILTRDDIRNAVDTARGKPYKDVFRRLRELQGEEGFLGIIKDGAKYQLIHPNISPKKTPRTSLSSDSWTRVLNAYHGVCAACGALPDETGFQQDHKIPRQRGGGDELTNRQPLCASCNIDKSVACRGCSKDCSQCSWAFPEFYRPVRLSGTLLRALNEYARANNADPSTLVATWIHEKIDN